MCSDGPDQVSTDLVEYFIVVGPTVDTMAPLATALAELVQRAAIRILDVVVMVKDVDGGVAVRELDTVAQASIALRPRTVGVIVVGEDRWAHKLSVAAQRAGGEILAGERIPSSRVELVSRQHSPDLLARPPCVKAMLAHGLLSPDEYERQKTKVLEP
jgi:hypothetical protein